MVAGFYDIWAKGVYIPRNSARTLRLATSRARYAELTRLACTYSATRGAGTLPLLHGERLIFTAPAVLHELRSTHRRLIHPGKKSRDIVWPHSGGARRAPVISPVDRGTLMLTNERFVYAGARKHREFPVGELTYVSGAREAIALGRRGRYGVSYFTGLDAVRISFYVMPGPEDRWKPQRVECPLTGGELVHVVGLLKRASATPPN